jgi:predicted O-methyltransferase YrrM
VAELVISERERRGAGFASVDRWPQRLGGFEDLAFLFSSTILAHGIASLRLDEAAYLYRLVRDERPRVIAEVGRFRGGSTLLLAAAGDAVVHSYDIAVRQGHDGSELDRELRSALERYGIADRVFLHVESSLTAKPPQDIDVLFVDGDHSDEGVRADFSRWTPCVRAGGHVLLHDAAAAADFLPTAAPGPERVAASAGPDWERRPAAGSLAHLVRRP